MKKINWTKVPENTLVYVWDEDEKPKFLTVKYFLRLKPGDEYPFRCRPGTNTPVDGYKNAELVRTEDIEKYTVEGKEPTYRPCINFEEFRPFFGKLAKAKESEIYKEITAVSFEGIDCTADNWFNIYELVKPINGSRVIGVTEE